MKAGIVGRACALLVILGTAAQSAAADDMGSFICKATKVTGSTPTKVGDRLVVGVSAFDHLTIIYDGGSGPSLPCTRSGTVVVCELEVIKRSIVFDTNTLNMTIPFGFDKDFATASCERLRLREPS